MNRESSSCSELQTSRLAGRREREAAGKTPTCIKNRLSCAGTRLGGVSFEIYIFYDKNALSVLADSAFWYIQPLLRKNRMSFLLTKEGDRVKKGIASSLVGLAAGVLNGLLGAGGGTVIVPMLEKCGLEPKKAHATSIAVIVPLCAMSAILYLRQGSYSAHDLLLYVPAGLVGAYVASLVLPKIPALLLRRLFGAFMLYAAYRLLIR